MSGELFLGLVGFAVITCFTPGPNNTMLLASGLNFGWTRSVPHVLGVSFGFAFMVLAVGLGVGQVFVLFPGLYNVLRVASIGYLLWLAWGIATAGTVSEETPGTRPLTVLEAALFQWINPKAWIMALGATTTYVSASTFTLSVAIMAATFGIVGFSSSASWAIFGAGLKRLLQRPDLVRALNVSMAVMLVLSLWPVVADLQR